MPQRETYDEDGVPTGFIDITQGDLCFRALDYHALTSAYRTAKSPESYLTRRRSQLKSTFTSSASSDLSSPVKYRPAGGRLLPVRGADFSQGDFYTVTVPARVAMGRNISRDLESFTMSRDFGDNPCDMEMTFRHPGTSMDSDCDDDEDMATKYPRFKATDTDSPIVTVAAEQLACIAFVGPGGQISAELQAAYPLQLSARIDDSRRCVIFDCFEYKPSECVDLDCENLARFLPTERGWLRWQNGYHSSQIDRDDDHYDDGIIDDDWGMDERMEMKSNSDGSKSNDSTHKMLIYCGIAGHFAYSRCLRVRFPFDNIIGVRLQVDDAPDNKFPDAIGGDATAVLILELSRPPPSDAFAVRKINSRWIKENCFELRDDWTPNGAASDASRIYMYGGLTELRNTAALMARKCPRMAAMLKSASSETNSLRDGTSIDYAAAPSIAVKGKAIRYGGGPTNRSRSFSDLEPSEKAELRGDIRMSLCNHCGAIYFAGHSGLACIDCGDGRWTIDKHSDPVSQTAFNGTIDGVLELFEAKCTRIDNKKPGTALKRKILG